MNCKKRRINDIKCDDHIKTNVITSECEFKWTIGNFKELLGTRRAIKSKEFSSKTNEFSGWYASLKIHNEEEEEVLSSSTETYISIHVNYNGSNESFLKVNFDLSVLNENGIKSNTLSLKNISPVNGNSFGFDKFIPWDELICPNSKLLNNDAIHFLFKISLTKFESELENNFHQNKEKNSTQLIQSKSYSSIMFKNSDFTDLTIVFDDVNLLVHKAIIADKSEVLYKKIKNLKDNELRLPISLSVGQELIEFIYTGQCPNLFEYVNELYESSIRLKIHHLTNFIELNLMNSITIENSSSRLIWAEERNVKNLKAHAIDFIKKNIHKVIETNGFKILSQNYQNLLKQVFFATVKNYDNAAVEI